jgi:hypothetical protein
VPDISAIAQLKLYTASDHTEVMCVESQLTNGKTANVAAVSYVAAGLAGLALAGSAASAVSSGAAAGGGVGATTIHPSFGDFVGTMQGIATTGMLSVSYPPVVRSFTQNFAFAMGIVPWEQLQRSIDSFRGATGGNLTRDSYEALRNTTLIFSDGSTKTPVSVTSTDTAGSLARRALYEAARGLMARGDGDDSNDDDGFISSVKKQAAGFSAFAESLMVPESNTFMTMLLVMACVIAAIVVSILLFKVILEAWALMSAFPKRFHGLRDDYWGIMARTITQLILLLYGIWVMFSIYQFTQGDSWAAIALAGTTLAGFSLLIAYFAWRIISTARKLERDEGSPSALFENKRLWLKYSLFYESYRQSRWWLFVPNFVYIVVRASVVAGLNGKGMMQTIALLVVESVMLMVMAITRPFERRSGNIINIAILVVRVISVAILLVFVEELGMDETTKSVSGVALIAVQSALTGVLGLLIAWNAVIAMFKENPHRRRRKEMEKLRGEGGDEKDAGGGDAKYYRDHDPDETLTPLDARHSLLGGASMTRSSTPINGSRDSLVPHAAPLDGYRGASVAAPGGYNQSGYSEYGGQPQQPKTQRFSRY